MSLLDMINAFWVWKVQNQRSDVLSVISQPGYKIDTMRNALVKTALAYKQTHLLFLDTDMTFPEDMIVRMIEDLEDNPEYEAVTGVYTYKTPPFLPHIYPKFNEDKENFGTAGVFPLNDIFEVDGAGFGCIMLKASVFKRAKEPYFKFIDGSDTEKRCGEDLYFCKNVRPKMLCDSRLQCLHYGTRGYGIMDYIQYNGLEYKDGQFNATKEQLEKIAEEQKNRAPKKPKN